MKFRGLLTGLLALPLLVAGCSCAKDGEYVEVEKEEVYTYINEVKENDDFEFKGYEFTVSAAGQVGLNGVFVSGEDGYQAKLEYLEVEEGEPQGVYIDGNTIYIDDGLTKKYATIPVGDEDLYSYEMALSLPTFEQLTDILDAFEELDSVETYKMTLRKEGTTTYRLSGEYDMAEGDWEIVMDFTVDLTFKDDKLIEASYKYNMLGISVKFTMAEYNGEVDFPSFANYVEDVTILDQYQVLFVPEE